MYEIHFKKVYYVKISPISFNNNIKFSSNYKKSYNYINQERMMDSFVKMARVDTGSDPNLAGKKCPTTKGQLELGKILAKELTALGLEDVEINENGFVMATLKGNVENAPTVALLAHMDTASDAITSNVNPLIHDYTEGDIELEDGQVISSDELKKYRNNTIITSDGNSLLGADDKAGIAEIIEALYVFQENPELKHPTIRVVFTPDEEGADGIENITLEEIKADLAYTIDGGAPEDIDTEIFNAYNPEITIKGVEAHCGYAYNKMINSIGIANEFISKLPKDQMPETTKDKEGYFHVDNIEGNVRETKINMLVRDFDDEKAKERIAFLEDLVDELQEKYPQAQIIFNKNESYKNIKEKLNESPEVVEFAKRGLQLSGLEPNENSVRGGTDGSELTKRGLPCPNLGAGGENFHTHREFVSLETMAKCCENIINIMQVWANEKNPFAK